MKFRPPSVQQLVTESGWEDHGELHAPTPEGSVYLFVAHEGLLYNKVGVGREQLDDLSGIGVVSVVADDDPCVFDLVRQCKAEQDNESDGQSEKNHQGAHITEHLDELFPEENKELRHKKMDELKTTIEKEEANASRFEVAW